MNHAISKKLQCFESRFARIRIKNASWIRVWIQEVKKPRKFIRWIQNWTNKSKDPFVIPKFIFFFIHFDFSTSFLKIQLKICWCNFSFLMLTPLDPNPHKKLWIPIRGEIFGIPDSDLHKNLCGFETLKIWTVFRVFLGR